MNKLYVALLLLFAVAACKKKEPGTVTDWHETTRVKDTYLSRVEIESAMSAKMMYYEFVIDEARDLMVAKKMGGVYLEKIEKDANGRVLSIASYLPDGTYGGTSVFNYDSDGRVFSVTPKEPPVVNYVTPTEYRYDNLGRISKVVSYQYNQYYYYTGSSFNADSVQLITDEMHDPHTTTTYYTYDDHENPYNTLPEFLYYIGLMEGQPYRSNNITSYISIFQNGNVKGKDSFTCTYDADGRLVKKVSPGTQVYTYTYSN